MVLLLYNLILILFLILFYFYSLHCPLSGPDLTYISLLIIPCIIYHVTNKETLNLELEMLVLKWTVTEKFRSYLLGSKFTITTDKNPLCHLTTAKLGAIEQRWAAQLVKTEWMDA